jgi:putrescine transport system substrate-binding protein
MSWSGDYAQAMTRAAEVGAQIDLAYTAPREGSVLWFDGIFIPADAQHPDNAHTFIDYLLRPDVIGDISNETHYANANSASLPFVDPAIVGDEAVYPPQDERDRFDVGIVYGPKQERLRTRTWSRVKTGL